MMRLSEGAAAASPTFVSSRAAAAAPAPAVRPPDWDEEEDGPWEPPAGMQPAAVSADGDADDSVAHSDPAAEAVRVAAELATQTATDSINFLAHCEEKLVAGTPAPCCSDQMVAALRQKVAADATDATPAEANASDAHAPAAADAVAVDALAGGVAAAAAGATAATA
jgi:hypothetical protein